MREQERRDEMPLVHRVEQLLDKNSLEFLGGFFELLVIRVVGLGILALQRRQPVLLALDACVHLRSLFGTRAVPLSQFFTGYRTTVLRQGEFIESVEIPRLKSNELLKVYKISKRFDDDISAVCFALWLKLDVDVIIDVRIGCGGMAATPARAFKTEDALRGKTFDEAALHAAGAALALDFQPLDDVRASAAYRLAVTASLLRRAWIEWRSGESLQVMTWQPEVRHA